mgnify:CR=1 FL=1
MCNNLRVSIIALQLQLLLESPANLDGVFLAGMTAGVLDFVDYASGDGAVGIA